MNCSSSFFNNIGVKTSPIDSNIDYSRTFFFFLTVCCLLTRLVRGFFFVCKSEIPTLFRLSAQQVNVVLDCEQIGTKKNEKESRKEI
jgi:hypothetical protein